MEGVNEKRPNKSVVKWQRHPSLTNNNENAENNDIWNASSNTISYNTCEIRQKFSVRDGLTYFTFKPIEF